MSVTEEQDLNLPARLPQWEAEGLEFAPVASAPSVVTKWTLKPFVREFESGQTAQNPCKSVRVCALLPCNSLRNAD